MQMMRRRDLLKLASAGTAAAVIGLRGRSSRAAEVPRARRVLLLNAGGGMRTTAAFNASTHISQNPWGLRATVGAIKLGTIMRASDAAVTYAAPSWGTDVAVPPIDDAARAFALIAGTDHHPDGSFRAGDHNDETVRMGTGYFGNPDAPGLLTLINRHLGATAAAPIATIGGGGFGIAPSAWLAHRPLELVFYQLPATTPQGGSANVGRPLEETFDARLLARRKNLARVQLQNFVGTKTLMRKFGPVLADDRLKFDTSAHLDKDLGGITNRMLLEAIGDAPGSERPIDFDARSTALGLRLLQMGAPGVCVNVGAFDTHDSEVQVAPALYTRFGRFLAGIHFALSRIPEPGGGGMMLDHTLVVTTSEFGRSSPELGFNAGQGTDHGSDSSWRYQAHVVFGAGVRPHRLADTTDWNEPASKPASTQALLATIAAAVGVPQDAIDERWTPRAALYPEGAPLWDLWA